MCPWLQRGGVRERDWSMTGDNRLLNRLRQQIERNGPISVADYMRICLTDPDYGYYTTSQTIGRDGDFITAPEVSQVFGELIGLFFADYWQRLGCPSQIRLVELGPGRGTLVADLLRAGRTLPGFSEAISIDLVEVSRVLRRAQSEALESSGHSPTWHDRFEDVPNDRPVFVIANEFFDALPIRQFVRMGGGWHERQVAWNPDQGALTFAVADTRHDGDFDQTDSQDGDVIEASPAACEMASSVGHSIAQNGGAALFIDYGYLGPVVGDTLQAVRAHAYADPLAEPGRVDLTGHVDFSSLKLAANSAEAKCWGPVSQGEFLRRLGLQERLGMLAKDKPEHVVASLRASAERLAGSSQMGRLFKALAISTPTGPAPAGF